MEYDEIILRNNRSHEPMSFERLKFLCYFAAGMTVMVLAFVALFMIIYFMGR